jgi:adenylosuccinate lyase
VHRDGITRNLEKFGPFAATEAVLMASSKRGADRQELHEVLRSLSMQAWSAVEKHEPNPLTNLLKGDPQITKYLKAGEIERLMDARNHVGLAAQRARALAKKLRALDQRKSAATVLDIKLEKEEHA